MLAARPIGIRMVAAPAVLTGTCLLSGQTACIILMTPWEGQAGLGACVQQARQGPGVERPQESLLVGNKLAPSIPLLPADTGRTACSPPCGSAATSCCTGPGRGTARVVGLC